MAYLVFTGSESGETSLFYTVESHNHDKHIKGLPDYVRREIEQLFQSGVKKPKAIVHALAARVQSEKELFLTLCNSHASNAEEVDGPAEFAFGDARISANLVFCRTALSYAFVNRKPVLPGHVLVASLRPIAKLEELGPAEIGDLFSCVQRVVKCIERQYGVTSSTITVQDGPHAGQSIPHVHVHILPRKPGDFPDNDDVYSELEKHDKGPDESKFRSIEDMEQEARILRHAIQSL